MSTKTITITDEAYNALKGIKEEHESFTDAILKVAKKDPLSRLVGVLTPKEAEETRGVIKRMRKKMNERVRRIAERMQ